MQTYRRHEEREPKKEFGLPAERKYPMPDANHARNAKARASQMEHQGKRVQGTRRKSTPRQITS